ncbi:MAG: catechol 1,2-dioxygenase [Cyanobacteria bacterium RYN_339]|nr:catechol 1,2-dioxygenase [Cyanobacteria bacterium RYN_339]
MGRIVGAGLLSHAPVIMFPQAMRIEANGGKDFTLATGLERLKREVFDAVDYDTVLVIDSHWATTTEFVITSQDHRKGIFTSSEMPAAFRQIPYDLPGDPELARAIAEEGTWVAAIDDPYLPVQYASLNLYKYLAAPGKAWVSLSVCQTATTADFLDFGRAIARGIAQTDRRVMLLASGGLSHVFRPLNELRAHMGGDPRNIVSPAARAADEQRIAWLAAGQHDRVIQTMPEFGAFGPEAGFGHYLTLAGALGGKACTLPGQRYSDYESGIGTGHVHLWFKP